MSDRVTICPNCGHRALTVATRCPHCSAPFDAHFYQRTRTASKIPRVPPLLLAAGVVVGLLAVNALWQHLTTRPRPAPAVTPRAPVEAAPSVAQPAPRADSIVASVESLPGGAASTPPAPVAAPAIENPAPPAAPRVAEATEVTPETGTGLRRYATGWINVRAERSITAPVLRYLQPGQAVLVDSLRLGWYRVVSGPDPPGYVDHRLLDSLPPAAAP